MIFELNQSIFSKKVEEKVIKTQCEYMEAVLDLCEEFSIEPQVAAKFLTKPIIEKIQVEGASQNLLPKQNKLPF